MPYYCMRHRTKTAFTFEGPDEGPLRRHHDKAHGRPYTKLEEVVESDGKRKGRMKPVEHGKPRLMGVV